MPLLFGCALTREDLARRVGDFFQLFGVHLYELGDGPERGVRCLKFRTGSGLEFDVAVDRGMDVASMTFRGVPIGWRSPAGLRSPNLHEFEAEDGFSWARSFSGLLTSCGLDHIHAPERDSGAHFHAPARPTIWYALHSRIGMAPARLKGYGTRWQGDQCYLFAEAEIRQAALFGENLVLERRIEVEVGASTVSIRDRVVNAGFHVTPHAYLWHVNLGWPNVSDGARLIAPIAKTDWQMRDDEEGDRGPLVQSAPRNPATQQVYDHTLRLNDEGTARAALVNDGFVSPGGEAGLALEIAYDGRAMPSLFQWQYFQEGAYVVAMEPCTTHAGTRSDWRVRGEFKMLGHGEAVDYRLEMTPHMGAIAIADLEARLA
ncbi:aldose 1-epimerase family protein [Oricola sp.]|uniref:aldose 1-epimerase family protein n=1 Tax=Oricola sp. TaxID=1979950 RepID=UPI003BACA3AF